MHQKYIGFLNEIILNSDHLISVAVLLFKESLNSKIREEKMTLVAYAQNFLFAAIDEFGKFYIIKSQYPNELEQINLTEIGFKDHNKKLSALITAVRKNPEIEPSVSQTIKMLRSFKDCTLYVDYKNGKVVSPHHSKTLNDNIFNNYIEVVGNLREVVKIDLELFKKRF